MSAKQSMFILLNGISIILGVERGSQMAVADDHR
jgi:hypothetical protein